jgi:cyclophilin family peptidyl-prolyl cis-trans isomerase
MYITLDARPDLDGRYAVFGQVVAGEDVPERLEVGDVITRMSVRE